MSIPLLQRQVACCAALCLAISTTPLLASPLPQAGQQAPSAASAAADSAGAQTTGAPAQANQQPATPPRPVGTAVAPYENTSGVTGSRPAGAVIAPAKQRRVRAIFIKIAVVVGAGAAIGAVAMLSHSSPSQPR